MILHVNPSSGLPLYLQILAQVKNAVAAGALQPGDALPSVRRLAADLRINPNTVARAYQELERDAVIRSVPGGGTFVADGQPGLLKAEKIRRLRPVARQLAVEGTQLRLTPKEIIELAEEELKAMGESHERAGHHHARTGEALRKTRGREWVGNERARGAVYGFLGRNGAGKTTTIKMLLGLARVTSGGGSVLGDIERRRLEILRRVAFVGENKGLYDSLTPAEMARFPRGFYPGWLAFCLAVTFVAQWVFDRAET